MTRCVRSTSLYIHFPWCEQKCPYCDFNSHTIKSPIPEERYLKALIEDLESELRHFSQPPLLRSIFLGGGTPSVFSPHIIERLLQHCADHFAMDAEIEITMEANPGTLHDQKLLDFRLAGVNRLSLGVQSFQDHHLKRLGRIHDAQAARSALDAAHSAGFRRLNIDLMHGLPNQTLAEALSDVETALAFQPGHLSWYQLTIEPNTRFDHERPQLPEEDVLSEIETQGLARLEQAGYHRYEISAYAQPGQTCQHNLNYWRFGDYIGIGAGAHGKFTHRDQIIRYSKYRHPKRYLDAPSTRDTCAPIAKHLILLETLMNRCRLVEPTALAQLSAQTGLSIETLLQKLASAQQDGLINIDANSMQMTALGHQYLDSFLQQFLDLNS